jgi:hypothetical protein
MVLMRAVICICVVAMSTVAAMHEQVHEWAQEQDAVRQQAYHMRVVFDE